MNYYSKDNGSGHYNGESKIFFTSDTHFGHDKDFIVEARGFRNVEEMNEAIVTNWNRVVGRRDTVYHLGDVYMADPKNIEYVKRLHGRIRLIVGNHETRTRIEKLKELHNIVSVSYAELFHYKRLHFYLSHYPTFPCDMELTEENYQSGLENRTLCLFGHTHCRDTFFSDNIPFIYNVGADAHNCTPVLIDDIIADMKNKHREIQEKIRRGEADDALRIPNYKVINALTQDDK